MDQRPSSDRRRHVRQPFAEAVRLFHWPSKREFPARSVDISEGGMLMYVPAETPVAQGQYVRITVAERQGAHAPAAVPLQQPLEATVVRVDREKLPRLGYLPVGVQFRAAVKS